MTKQSITGCVFDLDGTLADTAPDIANALNLALRDAGLAQLPLASVIGMIGSGVPTLVRRALAHLGAAESLVPGLVESMFSHYAAHYCEQSKLMPGVLDCLDGLQKRGLPMSVCTNKDERMAAKVVSALGLDSYFAAIVGRRPDLPKKPDPAMLFAAAAAIDSPLHQTMMIGDSDVDAATGVAAGCVSVIVRGGYCHAPYESLSVDYVLEDMSGLLAIVDSRS